MGSPEMEIEIEISIETETEKDVVIGRETEFWEVLGTPPGVLFRYFSGYLFRDISWNLSGHLFCSGASSDDLF